MKTLYDVLGVRANADDESIRTAFREAAKAHHPDLNRDDPNAALRFRQIVQASAVLRDAERRADYDRQLQVRRRQLWSEWTQTTIKCAIVSAVISAGIVGAGTVLAPKHATTDVAHNKVVARNDEVTRNDAVADKVQDSAGGAVAVMSAAPPAARDDANSGDDARDDHQGVQVAGNPQVAGSAQIASNAHVVSSVQVASDVPVVGKATDPLDAIPAMESGVAAPVPGLAWPAAASSDPTFFRELGIVSCRNGDFDRAIAALDQAIRLEPTDAQAHDIRGNIRDDMGDADRALADYDQAIRINPNDPDAFHDRGISWRRKGALDKAIVDLDRAIRFTFSDANYYSDRGLAWYEKGDRDRAMADFSRAIKIDRKFAGAYISRGLMLHRKGECNRMLAGIDRAIHIDPGIFEAVARAESRPER